MSDAARWFLGSGGGDLHEAAAAVADAVTASTPHTGPVAAIDVAALVDAVAALDPCPQDGQPLRDVLAELGPVVLAHGVRVADPRCAAHLHSPPLVPAAAAELAIGATNQSMDSFDQAPAATLVEDHFVRWLAVRLGLPARASGVFTAGGTASNLLALLLARDRAGRRAGADVRTAGLPADASRWRLVTSSAAHDSVRRAAAVLGLGAGAVVEVPIDPLGRMELGALDATLARLSGENLTPIAVVATAGTTDLGAIDPLAAVAERAAAAEAWFHVDAAVGSAFVLSERLRPRLDGIAAADSVTADLHKLWWQPIGASVLLVRDRDTLRAVHHQSDYLNRADDEADGVLNLVGRSLDTSRRFDALKVLVALRTVGRRELAAMLEHLVALTERAAGAVARRPGLELLAPPSTIVVAFRWRSEADGLDAAAIDAANVAIQRRLFADGRALLGRTRLGGVVALKLTLVNPCTTDDDVEALLDLVVEVATSALSLRSSGRPRGA